MMGVGCHGNTFPCHCGSCEPPGRFSHYYGFLFSLLQSTYARINVSLLENISPSPFWKKSLFVKICCIREIFRVCNMHMLHTQNISRMQHAYVAYAKYFAYATSICRIREISRLCNTRVNGILKWAIFMPFSPPPLLLPYCYSNISSYPTYQIGSGKPPTIHIPACYICNIFFLQLARKLLVCFFFQTSMVKFLGAYH